MDKELLDNLKFDEKGLIPVVAQDYRTGEVRMVAYANREAVEKTLQTGYAHYYSRSRQKIWKKGETSGELQRVKEVRVDCDGDTLLYIVEQEKNRACHTGERNCFYRTVEGEYALDKPLPFETLPRLQEVLYDRLENLPEGSYTTKLIKAGFDRIAQKFGEEAVEGFNSADEQGQKTNRLRKRRHALPLAAGPFIPGYKRGGGARGACQKV